MVSFHTAAAFLMASIVAFAILRLRHERLKLLDAKGRHPSPGRCEECSRRTENLALIEYQTFKGILFRLRVGTVKGYYCPACARAHVRRMFRKTFTLGWFSPALIYYFPLTVLMGVRNLRAAREAEAKETA